MAGETSIDVSLPFRRLFTADLRPRIEVIGAMLLAWGLWAALVYAAAEQDGVRRLEGDGRGLVEHYGYLVCFVTGPLVLITIYYAISYFLRLATRIEQFVIAGANLEEIRAIIQCHVDSIFLRGRARWMLALGFVIGFSIAFYQFSYLDHPEGYWGNDVFNAEDYRRSWWVANAYLLVLWGVIYPIGLFCVGHVAISSQLIVEYLSRRQILRVDLLHADGCAGMAKFGTLNLILMGIYGWMGMAVWALMITHRNTYSAAVISGVALSILFVVHSFLGVYSVYKAVCRRRDQAVERLNGRIGEMMDGKQRSFVGAAAAMQYRDRVLAVSAVPYASGTSAVVNLLRYAPAPAAGLAKVVLQFPLPI